MGRVTNFRNWVPELYGDRRTRILALEYWCYDEDALWREDDDDLIDRRTREIRRTGLIGDGDDPGGPRRSHSPLLSGLCARLQEASRTGDRQSARISTA